MNWLLVSSSIIIHVAAGVWAFKNREKISAWFKEVIDDEPIRIQAEIMDALKSNADIPVEEKKKIWQAAQANRFDAEKLKLIYKTLIEKIQKGNYSV